MEEIEVKFIDINVEELKSKLESLGATFVGKFTYRRKSYDGQNKFLTEKNSWLRLRDEGDKVTMAYKQRLGIENDHLREGSMKEIEITVSDFASTDELLKELGMIEKFYEENTRERYMLDDVEIDIDTWPMIPSYVELEGKSWTSVEEVAKKLGFEWSKHLRCSTMQIYEMKGINENDYKVITFTEQIKKTE